jgi:hypothetical protein
MSEEAVKPGAPSRTRVWLALLNDFVSWFDTGKLALAGVAWYGFLWFTYNEFYEPLGITPSAVGLSYATILANSVGAAVAFLLPLLALSLGLFFLALSVRWSGYEYVDGQYRRAAYTVITRNLFAAFGVLFVVYLVYLLPVSAGNNAQRVMRGEAVAPLHAFPSPAPVLAIQADPVITIKSVGTRRTGDVSAVESLATTGLLYMGQANSVIVLYDSSRRQAIYLPSSSVVLTVKPEK